MSELYLRQQAKEGREKRIKAIKSFVEQSQPQDVIQRILQGEKLTPSKAKEMNPHGELEPHLLRAHQRREIALILHEQERDLPDSLKGVLEEEEIGEYYDYADGSPEIKGHVDVVHGTPPSEKVQAWLKGHDITDYEAGVNEIGQKVRNNMIFKKSRISADVNHLTSDVLTSIRSERTVLSEEFNLHGVKSERALTRRMLKKAGSLDEDGKAKNPYLAIYLHGKADTRGNDFEIAAKQTNGKGPIHPLLAFWIQEKLSAKVKEKGIKNGKNEDATVNVVTSPGAYSGSPALTKMRYGDGLFDFKGFGENFQALQLEVSRHIRDNYKDQMGAILNELLAEFSQTFRSEGAMKQLDKYKEAYESNMRREKEELLGRKKIFFTKDVSQSEIGMAESIRDHFDVEVGDHVKIKGKKVKVVKMKQEVLKQGYTMTLNPEFEAKIGTNLECEKE